MSLKSVYPIEASELTSHDWRDLARILTLKRTRPNISSIESFIRDLPTKLRAHLAMNLVPNRMLRAARLCSVHKGINPHVIGSIFELLQEESDYYLPLIMDYPGYQRASVEIKAMVREVNAMNGRWSNDDDDYDDEVPRYGFRDYQHDGCEACMLARVGSSDESVCALRTVLLGRMRTHGTVKIPRLLEFVNECIKRHPNSSDIFDASDRVGAPMKDLRKDAVSYDNERIRQRRSGRQVGGSSSLDSSKVSPPAPRPSKRR